MHTGEISDNLRVVLKKKEPIRGPYFIYKNWELTEREVEILLLIAEGITSLQMAEKLFICKRQLIITGGY